jgi:hypothetical protein
VDIRRSAVLRLALLGCEAGFLRACGAAQGFYELSCRDPARREAIQHLTLFLADDQAPVSGRLPDHESYFALSRRTPP